MIKSKSISILLLTFIISSGCTKKSPVEPIEPVIPSEISCYDFPLELVQRVYDKGCIVCLNHMDRPETATFKSLGNSYIAITSSGLLTITSVVTSLDIEDQKITNGFIATFEVSQSDLVIYSFISWEHQSRASFLPPQ